MLRLILIICGLVVLQNGYSQNQNPCVSNSSFTVVVLGSSTAAGSGASTADSAWVNRYRVTITNINPNNSVINLGVGGKTTYNIMPDDYKLGAI